LTISLDPLKMLGFPISEEYGELPEHIVQISLPNPAHNRGKKSSGSKPNAGKSLHNAIFRILIHIVMMAMAIKNLPNFHLALMTPVWRRHQKETYPVWAIRTAAAISKPFGDAFQLVQISAVLGIRWR
jgi:hypothetical protein